MEKKEEKTLLQEALDVYEIPPEYVFASRVYPETNEVVIVTHGGKKFKHRKGEVARFELTEVQITGELPKEELRWSPKYNQGINLKTLFKRFKKKPKN